jgi:hypothetical protein
LSFELLRDHPVGVTWVRVDFFLVVGYTVGCVFVWNKGYVILMFQSMKQAIYAFFQKKIDLILRES